MKKQILLSFLLCSATTISVFAQQKLSLDECVNYALEHNLNIKQARLNEALSDNQYQQSKLNLTPVINGYTSQQNTFGRSISQVTNQFENTNTNSLNYGLNGNVDLFGGLRKINQIKEAKYALLADQSYVEKVRQDVSLSVVSQYLQILFNHDQVNNLVNQLSVSNEQVEMAKKKSDVGVITEADFLQLKAQKETDQSNLIGAQNQLEISILNMKQLLNILQDQAFDVERPGELELMKIEEGNSATYVYNEALKINPDIKVAELRRELADKSVAVAKSAFYPRLTMSASIGSFYSSDVKKVVSQIVDPVLTRPTLLITSSGEPVLQQVVNTSVSSVPFSEQYRNGLGKTISFSLSIPIFNSFSAKNGVKRAKINHENARVNEELAKNQLSKTITQSVADLKAAQAKYRSSNESFESFKKSYEFSQKRFDVGLLNSLDLNLAKTNYSKAESDALQAKYDMIFKSKIIDYYLGKPLTF